MLKIGIIGDIKLMEPYINHIRKDSDVQIAGKSSVGTHAQSDKFRFTIPEFNRVELIDRCDVLLINNFSILRFSVLCEIIKKSKHIFTTTYPKLSLEESSQLIKLTHEAKTIFQITNPFLYLPAVQWLKKNIKYPAYIDITYFRSEQDNVLMKLLSMLKGITGINFRKINAVFYSSPSSESDFKNIRLQLGDGSIVNLNCGKLGSADEFMIKVFSEGQFSSINFNSKSFFCNNSPIDLKKISPINELDIFVSTVKGKNREITNLEDYHTIYQVFLEIDKKLSQFSGQ